MDSNLTFHIIGDLLLTEYGETCEGRGLTPIESMTECKANIEDLDKNQMTPLLYSVKAGHIEIAKILLTFDEEVKNYLTNEYSIMSEISHQNIMKVYDLFIPKE